MAKTPTSRIDKLLSSLGYGSRTEIPLMARSGRITLNNVKIRDVTKRIPITPDLSDCMKIDGEALDPVGPIVILLNKPLGMTCSHKEDGELVYDLLPERWQRRVPAISTIGRLDKQTSGLLLLTDDGALLHRVISPKRLVKKTYRATLARPLDGTEGDKFASGELMLASEDKPLAPALLEVISDTEALLTVTEGRYHQVRRMFAAAPRTVGRPVASGRFGPRRMEAAGRRRDQPDFPVIHLRRSQAHLLLDELRAAAARRVRASFRQVAKLRPPACLSARIATGHLGDQVQRGICIGIINDTLGSATLDRRAIKRCREMSRNQHDAHQSGNSHMHRSEQPPFRARLACGHCGRGAHLIAREGRNRRDEDPPHRNRYVAQERHAHEPLHHRDGEGILWHLKHRDLALHPAVQHVARQDKAGEIIATADARDRYGRLFPVCRIRRNDQADGIALTLQAGFDINALGAVRHGRRGIARGQ